MNLSPEAIQRLEANMEMDEIKRTDRKEWEHLPVGAWFFCNTPSCTFPYTVMERTDSGCTQVCGSPWTAPWAVEQMKEIAASHNQLMNHAAPPAQGAPTPKSSEIGGGSLKAQAVVPRVPEASRESDTGGESYPGQKFFHEHNERIKRAELAAQGAPGTREAVLIEAMNAVCWMCREGQKVEPKGGRFVHPNPYGDNFGKEGVMESAWKWCDASDIRALAQPGAPTKGDDK
jgi:hypothetical protein